VKPSPSFRRRGEWVRGEEAIFVLGDTGNLCTKLTGTKSRLSNRGKTSVPAEPFLPSANTQGNEKGLEVSPLLGLWGGRRIA